MLASASSLKDIARAPAAALAPPVAFAPVVPIAPVEPAAPGCPTVVADEPELDGRVCAAVGPFRSALVGRNEPPALGALEVVAFAAVAGARSRQPCSTTFAPSESLR